MSMPPGLQGATRNGHALAGNCHALFDLRRLLATGLASLSGGWLDRPGSDLICRSAVTQSGHPILVVELPAFAAFGFGQTLSKAKVSFLLGATWAAIPGASMSGEPAPTVFLRAHPDSRSLGFDRIGSV